MPLGILLLLAGVYFAAGKLGLKLAFVHASATAVWPPTGIALAAFLLLGRRVWPGIFLGAFLVNLTTAGSFATSLGIATGNTLEGVAGAYLVERFAGGRNAFARSQDVFKFVFLASVASTMISATLGVSSLCLGGFADVTRYGSIWLTWWLGDATGGLIVAPLLVLWSARPRAPWAPGRGPEALLLLLAALLLGSLVFGGLLPFAVKNYPLEFICIPLLVWSGFRFGVRESATVTFLLSAIAVWGTLRGVGPFARASPNESLLLLQAFMGVITVMGLALAAVVAERRRVEAKLVHLLDHDPLTDLFSRRRFEQELAQQLAQARRYGVHGAVVFFDLDGFKAVNDSLGHAAGDELLAGLARLLRGRLRDSDLLARLGGDEFAILLPYTDGSRAQAVAAQLLKAIEVHPLIDGQPVAVTASMGIALFPEHGSTAEEVLAHADIAMYQAKDAGGNLCRVYAADREWQEKVELRFRGERALRDALERGLFLLHGQPILDLRRGSVWQHELLLRMAGPSGELLPPGAFLGLAEQSGLIQAIERWVVREAIHLIARHRRGRREPRFAVNLTGRAFSDGELLPLIRRELAETSIHPGKLTVEITETAAFADAGQARRFALALKNLGCRLALDDFGVGFSSLYHLKHLPVDYVKIDGSFVRDLLRNPADRHIVKAMVEMARALRIKTVAEFVGDEESVHLLRDFGVDYAQGFHIGRPRPLTEIG